MKISRPGDPSFVPDIHRGPEKGLLYRQFMLLVSDRGTMASWPFPREDMVRGEGRVGEGRFQVEEGRGGEGEEEHCPLLFIVYELRMPFVSAVD